MYKALHTREKRAGLLLLLLLLWATSLPLQAQTRLGLHVSREELSLWRERIRSGPYRIAGDAGMYSPGDYSRITSNANAFLTSPALYRWKGPVTPVAAGTKYNGVDITGAFDKWGDNEPTGNAIGKHIRDAAFVYLLERSHPKRAALKAAIRQELLYAPSIPGLDFTNQTKWPRTYYRDVNPIFQIMNWFNCYLFALDYIDIADAEDGTTTFSAAERDRLYKWFTQAAEFARYENDWDVDRNFTNRQSSPDDADYKTATVQGPSQRNGKNLTTHYTSNGPGRTIYGLMQTMNNRRMASYRYACLVGIKTGNSRFMLSAKRFVKDWIKYSVFTDGTMGEMERWGTNTPDIGWAYCTDVMASAITIADALARTGDGSLYSYQTSIGRYGTEGTNGATKGLLTTMKMMYKITAKQVKWYGTNLSSNATSYYLIDGQHGTWKALHDVWLTQANLYYKDSQIRAMYMRNAPGMDPYWSNPVQHGRHPVWTGDWGIFPGVLFMFGQTESLPSVYKAAPVASSMVLTMGVTNVDCNGQSTGSASVAISGGVAPYTYLWSTGQRTAAIYNLKAASYTVSVTDGTGASMSRSVSVSQPAALTLTSTVSAETEGSKNGAITLWVNGGVAPYSYLWSTGATTKDISLLSAGTYSVKVSDSKGCTAQSIVSVTEAENTPFGQSVVSFTLINADNEQPLQTITSGGEINLYNLPTKNLNIRANTDPFTVGSVAFALSGTSTKIVTETAAPYALFGDVSGNYNPWTPPLGSYSLSATPYSGASGTGTKGNTLSVTFTIISQPAAPFSISTASTPVACNGQSTGAASVNASGGIAPYTYLWSTGATSSVISGIKAGIYTVTATDAKGVKVSRTITLSQPAAISITPVISQETGTEKNGSITLSVGGGTAGYAYRWSTGATTKDISSLSAGTYTVTVTDQQACMVTSAITVGRQTLLSGQSVVSFTLINADNEQPLLTILAGDTINLQGLPTRNLNIRANTNPQTVGSVAFALSGTAVRNIIETAAPYALYGDVSGNYNAWKAAAGTYALTAAPYSAASGTGTKGNTLSVNFTITDEPLTAPEVSAATTGKVSLEYWGGIVGTDIKTVPAGSTPQRLTLLTSFEAPANVGDNYAQRVRGYLHPLQSGTYTFYLAADDAAELYLSTDENPLNKQRLAYTTGYVSWRQWNKYATQKSAAIYLQGGKKYYIEALHKEGIGGDNLSVGWTTPAASTINVIGGAVLSPFTAGATARMDYGQERVEAKTVVYPNPFTSTLTFKTERSGQADLLLSDLLGRTVWQGSLHLKGGEGELNLAGSGIEPGVYLLSIKQSGGGQEVVRIVKGR